MKKAFTSILSLCIFLPSLAHADNLTAKSDINAVTVYSNRAKVTRTADIKLPKGAHTISFKNLPANILTDSLRANGEADVVVKIGALAHKRVISRDLTSEREKELNDKILKLQDQVKILNTEKDALQTQKNFLKNIGKQASLRTNEDIAEIKLNPEEWAKAAKSLHSGMSETMQARVQMDFKIRDLNKDIQKLQRELNQSRTGQRSTYEVKIPIETDTATTLTVALDYQVPNASWQPIYDARLSTDGKGKLDLIQYGSVRQRTGEDWSDVDLTLSTAQPQRGSSLPDLTPMWVNAYSTKSRGGFAGGAGHLAHTQIGHLEYGASNMAAAPARSYKKARLMEMDALEATPIKQEAQFVAAQINTGGFVSEYKVLGPSSILTDGTETKLMVGAFETETLIQVHIKPQISTEAFLVAKSKLKGEAPILPGRVSLFRDGAFVGKSSFPLLRPNEEHGLYFGIDDQVSVKRRTLKDKRSESGLIVKDNTLSRNFVTEIQNLHKTPVEIVVKETIPSSKNEKVVVSIDNKKTTAGFETDVANIKGMLRWTFNMDTKAKKDLKLGWDLTWPADHQINGLRY